MQPSTTYARDRDHNYIGEYSYSRAENPSWAVLEQVCAQLDGGAEALCFGSGMAAVTAFFDSLNSGEHIVAPRIMYHGSQDWLRRISAKRGIGLSLFDAGDAQGLQNAVKPGETAVVWIESSVNPTWEVIDIRQAADVAHSAGAILAVDCTVTPPVTTRALDFGADIVFHSGSKYYNGHSDVLAGLLVTRELNERWEEIKLERVLYPGLETHPGHEIAARQMLNGFGGMISFLVKGEPEQARLLASSTELFLPATSLGGVESLIEHRASVEGPHSIVPGNLVRLSVGIENCDDLIADLERSLGEINGLS